MPGRAGLVLDDPVQVEDLYPTFLGMTGCRAELDKPGDDLCPLIRGEQKHLSREGILLGQVRQGRGWEMWRAFRSPRYKYSALGDPTGGKPWQFFDLNKDPYEMTNLVHDEEFADLVRSHHRHLLEHLATSQDHFVVAPAWGERGFNTWS
jgi:arylsulfatase A-like enzyme